MKLSRMLTPPVVARILGVDPSKVLGWIRRGELRAVNVATSSGGRPRWRIAPSDLKAFLQRRQSRAPVVPQPRRRRRKREGVTEFF
jgi:excisionase family DNA binding protein